MGIGGSIFLIAVGAIIAFGINVHPGALNLYAIGWILMLVGLFGLGLTLWIWNSRRRRVITRRRVVDPTPPTYVEPRRVYDPTPPAAYPVQQTVPASETYVEEEHRSAEGPPRPY